MVSKNMLKNKIICVVGLGYVGMPLAEAFSKYVNVIGFDVNENKVEKLQKKYPHLFQILRMGFFLFPFVFEHHFDRE